MKKNLCLFGVFLLVMCNTLVGIAENPLTKVINGGEMKISQEFIAQAMSKVPTKDSRLKQMKALSDNVDDVVIDHWSTAPEIYLNGDGMYDATKNLLTFSGSQEQTAQILYGLKTGTDGSKYFAWSSNYGATYIFGGKLSSNGYVEIVPCILYANNDDEYWHFMQSTTIVLDENNDYSSEFNISVVNNQHHGSVLSVAYLVQNSSSETVITADENSFSCSYRTVVAQKWSEEIDLPGLGLNSEDTTQTYTVLCEDGVTTLGLKCNGGELYVTGINTTADSVSFPKNITINGSVGTIDYFNSDDWSGAPNLCKLYITNTKNVSVDFTNSKVTDLYIDANCYFSDYCSGLLNIYLHIPYGSSRGDYYGFKRVLVGYEQPEYPISEYSDWIIAGENEGDYFGIDYVNSEFQIVEIFTEKDSIVLPIATPAKGGMYYITGIGDDYYDNKLCKNASKLKILTIPATYNNVEITWDYSSITDLHMLGDVPSTYWSLSSKMSVYTAETYYFNYKNDSRWNSATILPDGWDFEWMTVNVGRKGEFAQTYIEMTDADWSLGVNVKVTGALNDGDLKNIDALVNLMKLDLSEAEFTELPSSFLSYKSSLVEVILPNSLTSISSSAFYHCTGLKKVVADSVKVINSSAFNGCRKLTDFDISNVISIGNAVFYECLKFNPLELSSELVYLGNDAFCYSGITEVSIPNTLTTINSSVFSHCIQLQKVTLPNTLTTISSSAFSGCSNLIEINLPEGIVGIGVRVFENCSKLTEITLPSTLENIGYDLLTGCASLTTVKCKAIVPPTTAGRFTSGIDLNNCILYVAPFSIGAYRDATDWNDFYIMKPLNEPIKNIYVNRPTTFDLLSEDNAVLQDNPNMVLDYGYDDWDYVYSVGQLSASGDGTLSAGIFSIFHKFYRRTNSSSDIRTTLVNNAENMRADSVMCSIEFEKNYWHFISFQYDVKMEDIFGLNNTDFVIRRYNSANRASGDGSISNWEQLSVGDVLEAGKGYIIQVANNSYDENGYGNAAIVRFPSRNTVTKNKLFTSNNVIVPLEEHPAEFAHNRSWNLVGNPYPCYFDMHYLMDDFTTPIVLWRGTSYQAYSPIDDDIILRPNEAFFVQRPLNVEQMVFGAEGRMHFDEAYNSNVTPGSRVAPLHTRTAVANRSVFNFNIAGCGSDDRARIVMNENASMDYEINCDASKFFAESSQGAEIYVDGAVKYDICERPFADGTALLGTRIAKNGEYTISLTGRGIEGWTVILKDKQTGFVTDLTENDYKFDAEVGTISNRFEIVFNAPEQTPTSIDNAVSSENNTIVRILNTAGVLVYEGNIDNFHDNAIPGVYIVVDSEKAYKIVVK